MKGMHRYGSAQRPVAPGSYPKEQVDCIVNFPDRVYCEEIGREAWGYIDYRLPLTEQQIEEHELIEGGGRDQWEQ